MRFARKNSIKLLLKGEKRMIKAKWMKKLLTTLCIALIAVTAIAMLPTSSNVKAENVTVSNNDFSSYSSTYAPDDWTKLGDNNSEAFSGVYDGKVGQEKHGFKDDSVLSKGNEFSDFLVINSKGYSLYSAYASSDIAVAANSYYQFTVRAKANVSIGGAYFIVYGLDEEIVLPIGNDETWQTYKIYVATDFNQSGNANVRLSFGKDEAKAKGYAMFDDVSIETLTAYDFAQIEDADNILIADLTVPYTDDIIKGGDFTTLDYNYWTVNENKFDAAVSIVSAANTNISEGKGNVTAPNYIGVENNVLRLNSLDNENGGFINVTSKEFTVKRDEYYRVSYFVYDENETATTGVGATAKLYYKYASSPSDFKTVTTNNIQVASGNYSANECHFGWVQRDFYIKGSSYVDTIAKIEFSLGTETSPTVGSVLIDDVRIQKLTAEQYDAISPDSSVVADADSEITDETGVTNGMFHDYTVTDGVKIPNDWTAIKSNDSDVAVFGYSDAQISTENASYCVVNNTEALYAGIGAYELAMKIQSSTETIYGLRSEAISVAANAYSKITVNLAAFTDGHGANIVLRRSNGAIVSKLEKITNRQFNDYSFIVKGDSANATDIYVEVWLGLNDRNANMDKLSSGEIFVKSVSCATSDEASYTAFVNSNSNYEVAVSVDDKDTWMAYDKYDESKPLYNWDIEKTVESGHVTCNVVTLDDEDVIKFVNVTPNASVIKLSPAINITASSYYKVSLQIKINGHLNDIDANEDGYLGAWAGIISGSDTYATTKYVIKNVKETTLNTSSTNYLSLEFYIKGGDADETVTLFVGLGEDITPEKDQTKPPYTQGSIYIKDVSVATSSTTEYAEAQNENSAYKLNVNLSDETTSDSDDETTSSGWAPEYLWLTLSSIFFALAIIAVVVVFAWKKFAKKHKKAVIKGRPAYDRKVAGLKAADDDSESTKVTVDNETGTIAEEANLNKFDDDSETVTEENSSNETEEETTGETSEEATEEETTEEASEEVTEEETTEEASEDKNE